MLAKDGTRASYCAHTRNLTFNSLDYSAAPVEASRANLTLGLMEANTTDLYGVFDDTVTEEDVIGGKWNNAEIVTELVNYLDLSQGSVRRMKGNVGKFNIKNGSYIVEFQSLSARLRQEIGELTSPVDRNTLAELVDDLAPYTFARNVTAVTDRRNFTVDGTAKANGYFRYGKVTFTSGDNDDLSMEIKDNTGNVIELQLPMRSDIAISDTVSLLAGYDGSREQARDKFSAAENMSAEPDLPGIKTILKYPE